MYFERGLRFGDYFPDGLLLSIPNERSVLFFDAIQNVRCVWAPAAVWENRVCKCQLGQSDLAAAQKCGRVGAKRRTDARRGAKLQHCVDSRVHSQADRCAIFGFGQCLPRCHRAFITVVSAFWTPFAKNSRCATDHHRAIIQRRILNQRSGVHSFLESGGVNKRRHCSSGGPAGLQRTVVLVVLEIASAYQHENVTSRVVEANDGALQIFGRGLIRHFTVCLRLAKGSRVSGVSLVIILRTLLNRFEMSTDRILRCLLEIDIDGRVNAKAFIHRAVPSYGRDHLLPDVIDRVRLSLRVLPAPDGDLFRSCSGAPFAADKAEVAHPIERKVAHFA